MHSGVDQRHQQLHQRRTAAAEALGQHIGPQQQHGPRLALAERLAHPAGVAAHQVGLQLRQASRGNPHIRQLAEAGVDPVDRLPRSQYLFYQGAAPCHALQRRRRNSHRAPGQRNRFNLGQRQRLAIQNECIHLLMVSCQNAPVQFVSGGAMPGV